MTLRAAIDLGGLKLSPQQAAIWKHQVIWPASTAFNQYIAFPIDHRAEKILRRKVELLTHTVPIIRSAYIGSFENPQRIELAPESAAVTVAREVIDLDQPAGRAIDMLFAPVDLRSAGQLRLQLVSFRGAKSLVLRSHHVLTDARALQVIREYLQSDSFQAPGMLSRDVQYENYVAGLDAVSAERISRQNAFFGAGTSFRGISALSTMGSEADVARTTLSRAAQEQVTSFCRDYGSTPFVVLLANVLAFIRASGIIDTMTVGFPLTHRLESRYAASIGTFSTMVPLRVEISKGDALPDLTARIAAFVGSCLRVMAVPMEHEAIDAAGSPDVVFSLLDVGDSQLNTPLGDLLRRLRAARTSRFPIEITAVRAGSEISLEVTVSKALEVLGDVSAFAGGLSAFIEAAVAHPQVSIELHQASFRSSISGSAERPHPSPATPAASSQEQQRLLNLVCESWSHVLCRSIGPSDNFFDCGGDSVSAVDMVVGLRQELGCSIPFSMVYDSLDAADFARRLKASIAGPIDLMTSQSAAAASPTQGWKQDTCSPRLYLHPPGSAASAFNQLKNAVPGGESDLLLAVVPARRQSVAEVAARLPVAAAVKRASAPVTVVGWSFTAFVAYELAALGPQGSTAVMLDPLLPERGLDVPSPQQFLKHLASRRQGSPTRIIPEGKLDVSSFAQAIETARRYGLIPAGGERRYLRHAWVMYQRARLSLASYEPTPSHARVVMAFACRSPAPGSDFKSARGRFPNAKILKSIEGDHYGMLLRISSHEELKSILTSSKGRC